MLSLMIVTCCDFDSKWIPRVGVVAARMQLQPLAVSSNVDDDLGRCSGTSPVWVPAEDSVLSVCCGQCVDCVLSTVC